MSISFSPFLTILNQIKVFHWQTKSYSQHKSFDSAYEELSESIDEFLETYMGIYERPFSGSGSFVFSIDNYQEDGIIPFIDEAKAFLVGLSSDSEVSRNTDLLNIRDEMLGTLNQLKYLLTLT